MLHSRREVFRLGLGLGAALLAPGWLAACGGGDGFELSKEQRELLGPFPVLRDVPTPKASRTGTLRLGATPDTLVRTVRPLTSAQLVAVDPRGAVVYGDLAEHIELAGEIDIAFRLREDLRFHPDAEGLAAALTSDSVRLDFERRAAGGEYLFSQVIDRVETPDQRTVVLRLTAPFALLFEYLADPDLASIRADASYPFVDLPRSAGPFIPAAREGQRLLLAANQLYHRRGLPLLEAVSVELRDDAGQLDQLAQRAGLDVHRAASNLEGIERESLRHVERPTRGLRGIGLSATGGVLRDRVTAPPPFQDERVRRAVALVIDRHALLEVAGDTLSGPVGPAFPADALTRDEIAAHAIYQRHIEAARGLLQAAGHADLDVTLTAADSPTSRALAEAMVGQLGAAGFRARAIMRTTREWEVALRAGDFDATLFEAADLRTPDAGLRLHTAIGVDGAFSPWGYSNPVYDAEVRHALSALAPAERAERAHVAQRTLLDSVPALLPLSAPTEHAWVAATLEGYEWEAQTFNDGWLAALWRFTLPAGRR